VVLERVQVQQRRDRLVQSVRAVLNVKILWIRFSEGLRAPALGGALSRQVPRKSFPPASCPVSRLALAWP
jgi:hypothetical protein